MPEYTPLPEPETPTSAQRATYTQATPPDTPTELSMIDLALLGEEHAETAAAPKKNRKRKKNTAAESLARDLAPILDPLITEVYGYADTDHHFDDIRQPAIELLRNWKSLAGKAMKAHVEKQFERWADTDATALYPMTPAKDRENIIKSYSRPV
ncbi:hypothetical protein BDW74DRAFT_173017 [Aspergillus multicolor]|uniref:uncharacterized protein n=1 Tax=Aspergillus multicolor TaxID=41759 RepID=UPI003CCCD405